MVNGAFGLTRRMKMLSHLESFIFRPLKGCKIPGFGSFKMLVLNKDWKCIIFKLMHWNELFRGDQINNWLLLIITSDCYWFKVASYQNKLRNLNNGNKLTVIVYFDQNESAAKC